MQQGQIKAPQRHGQNRVLQPWEEELEAEGTAGLPALGGAVGQGGGGTWPAGRGRPPSPMPHTPSPPQWPIWLPGSQAHAEGGTDVQPFRFLQWLGHLPLAAAGIAGNNSLIRNLPFFAPFPSLWPACGQELPKLAAQKNSGRTRLPAGIR